MVYKNKDYKIVNKTCLTVINWTFNFYILLSFILFFIRPTDMLFK